MKRFLFLTLGVLALGFAACSSDSDDDNGGGNGNGGVETKLVKKILTDGDYSEEFSYDNSGRAIKVIRQELTRGSASQETTEIQYGESTITCILDYGYVETYTLDDNGYCVKKEEFDADGIKRYSTTFTYSDGYMSESKHYSEDDDMPYSTVLYTWQDGNMISAKKTDEFNNITNYAYTFNAHENKLNVANGNNIDISDIQILKFNGAANKNLMSSYTEPKSGATEYREYTFDSDGYPTKIVETGSDGGTYITHITYY